MKVALYSVLVGKYDYPIEPDVKFDGVDCIFFTDGNFNSDFWNVQKTPKFIQSERKTSRHPKILSNEIFSEYDFTVYIDANMFLTKEPNFYIDEFLGDKYDFAHHKNPYRDCLYEEAIEIRDVLKFEEPKVVNDEIEYIMKEGFPKKNGLGANHLLVRRVNKDVKKMESMWWDMIEKYSYRDQLSLEYCLWKNNTKRNYIEPYKKYIIQRDHRKKKVTYS